MGGDVPLLLQKQPGDALHVTEICSWGFLGEFRPRKVPKPPLLLREPPSLCPPPHMHMQFTLHLTSCGLVRRERGPTAEPDGNKDRARRLLRASYPLRVVRASDWFHYDCGSGFLCWMEPPRQMHLLTHSPVRGTRTQTHALDVRILRPTKDWPRYIKHHAPYVLAFQTVGYKQPQLFGNCYAERA